MCPNHLFKSFCYLLILPFLLLSCKDEETFILNEIPPTYSSHYVSYEQALDKALAFLTNNNSTTRAQSFKVKSHYEFSANNNYEIRTRATDLIEDTIDIRFHVINFEDNAGFALVSADDRTTPIYAYSTESNLDLEEGIANTGLSTFMEGAILRYREEIRLLPVIGPWIPDPAAEDSFLLCPRTIYNGQECYVKYHDHRQQVSPLLTTLWNQSSPYNYYCPIINGQSWAGYENRAAAGCVTIALAQIMAYYNYPNNWDWGLIHTSPSYSEGIHNETTNEVAQFVYDVAISANISWGIQSSSNIYNANSALENWNYITSAVQDFDCGNVVNSLKVNQPVYCRGTQPGTNEGHAWVIDGYNHTTTFATYYAIPLPHVKLGESSFGSPFFYHCNWGWGGNNNGYFIDTFSISEGQSFSANTKIIYYAHPNL